MTVVRFPSRSEFVPRHSILAFVDLQKEYVSEGRPFAIGSSVHPCVRACARLLGEARRRGIVVAHFRQQRRAPCFNPASAFFDWIEGFRPRASEAVYERGMPSIYSNAGFADYVDGIDQPTILLAGLSGETACLASAVDAHHRKHRLIFVGDCSASPKIGDLSEEVSHATVTDIIGRFADVTTSAELLALLDETQDQPRRYAE